jgi:ribonucleotide reductase beta subunit family protein with ferritin-like domain
MNKNYTLFPINPKYQNVWQLYKHHMSVFWTVEEIDLSKDKNDWDKLSENEKHFITHVLAFFAGSDGIVNENIQNRFINEIDSLEVTCFYNFQEAMENIHSETYSLLIDTYIDDTNEKNKLFNGIHTIPCIQKKAQWALKWIDDKDSNFATRLVAFACVEGIFFSGSFCSIYWLKKRGLMPGLTFSNELISRDEGIHTDFAVELYKTEGTTLSENIFYKIVKEAVNIEQEFITEALPCNLIGMNSMMMKQYIEFVADRLISQFGYNKIYNSENPFDFMELISMRNKTNFFEKRVSEYSKAGVNVENNEMEFDLGADF